MIDGSDGLARSQGEQWRALFGEVDGEIAAVVAGRDSSEALRLAEDALSEYDYEKARQLLEQAVVLSHGDAEKVCRLASFLVDEYAIFDRAVALLTSPLCESSPRSRRLLARALFHLGERERALLVYEEIHREGGGDVTSWKRQGKLLLDLGRPAEAIVSVQKALALDGADAEALQLRAAATDAATTELAPGLAEAEKCVDGGDASAGLALLEGLSSRPWLPADYYRLRARAEQVLRERELAMLLDRSLAEEQAGNLTGALEAARRALEIDGGCELAASRIGPLERELARGEAGALVARAQAAVAQEDEAGAAGHLALALARSPEIAWATVSEELGGLLELVRSYLDLLRKQPGDGQRAQLAALHRARRALSLGKEDEARLWAGRGGPLLEQLPAGRELGRLLAEAAAGRRRGQAQEWVTQALAAESAGDWERACQLHERAAGEADFLGAGEAAAAARRLRERLAQAAARQSALALLGDLVQQGSLFQARRELVRVAPMLGGDVALTELESRIEQGLVERYPLTIRSLPSAGLSGQNRYASGVDGVEGLVGSALTVVRPACPGLDWLVVGGRRGLLVDCRERRLRMEVELPPQCDVSGRKGFVVSDIGPGDRQIVVVVNFEQDELLYFQRWRSQFELLSAFKLNGALRQTRQQVTRWFSLAGPDEQLVVCQSAPGAGGGTQLYTLSLVDGRMLSSEEYNQTLGHLRRVSEGESSYLLHRHPEPALMRRPGYFSHVLLDGRMRIQERLNVGADELESCFIESTQWVRFGAEGRRYWLFRYFDAYSGQLVGRPLAFVATDRSGRVLFSAPDSSTLVRNEGDLEPTAETVVHDGREFLVILGRKKPDSYLFVVDLATFRVRGKLSLDPALTLLGLERGDREGTVTTIGLHGKKGELVLERVNLFN